VNRSKPAPRLLQVVARRQLSPNLLRLTFTGEALSNFPPDRESATLKLLLPHDGQSWSDYLASLAGQGKKPVKRTYTLRSHRPELGEIDIDFSLHENPGPATRWAMAANIGSELAISGPGRQRLTPAAANRVLFFADMSALPALQANLEKVAANVVVSAFVHVIAEQDKQPLAVAADGPDVSERWIVEADHRAGADALCAALIEHYLADAYYWIAGEATMVKRLRDYLMSHSVPRSDRHCSGYWQAGFDEDNFQPIKRGSEFD